MSDEIKTVCKIGALIAVGWFALITVWPVTFWWIQFLDKHLRLNWGQP